MAGRLNRPKVFSLILLGIYLTWIHWLLLRSEEALTPLSREIDYLTVMVKKHKERTTSCTRKLNDFSRDFDVATEEKDKCTSELNAAQLKSRELGVANERQAEQIRQLSQEKSIPPAPAGKQKALPKALGIPGNRDPCSPNNFFRPRGGAKIDALWLREVHHYSYGRPWVLGRDVSDFMIDRIQLQPDQHLLDFGMGSLRNGIHLIPYLEKGHYCGIEADDFSFAAASGYELKLHDLQKKDPTLIHNSDREPHIEECGFKFDYILAFSVLQHIVDMRLQKVILTAMAKALKPGGSLILTHKLMLGVHDYDSLFGLSMAETGVLRSKWVEADTVWWRFEKQR